MAPLVEGKDSIIQALGTQLDLGYTQLSEPGQFGGVDFVGACFDHEADVAMKRVFVKSVSRLQFQSFFRRVACRTSKT